MHAALARIRSSLTQRSSPAPIEIVARDEQACSWDELRAVYEEQAARGVPEAIRGLELIKQDRWPSSGRPRNP